MNWLHIVFDAFLVIVVCVLVLALIGSVVLWLARHPRRAKKIEKEIRRAEASPAVADLEKIAETAARAAVAQARSSSGLPMPSHPLIAAAVDVVQESQQVHATLEKVQKVLAEANAVADAKPKV